MLRLNVLSERQGKERKAAQELLLFMGIRTSCGCTAFNRLNNYMAFLFMKDSIFNEVLEKVSEVTGIDRVSVICRNKEECTDARYILILSLIKLGFTDSEISSLMGKSRQTICYMRNSYKRVGKWKLSNDLQNVSEWLANNYLKCK